MLYINTCTLPASRVALLVEKGLSFQSSSFFVSSLALAVAQDNLIYAYLSAWWRLLTARQRFRVR